MRLGERHRKQAVVGRKSSVGAGRPSFGGRRTAGGPRPSTGFMITLVAAPLGRQARRGRGYVCSCFASRLQSQARRWPPRSQPESEA